MAELIGTVEDIIENVETLFSYGLRDSGEEKKFHDKRIKDGKLFVAVQYGDRFRFAPSKFVGYISNDISHLAKLRERDGRKTNVVLNRLLGEALEPDHENYQVIDQSFLQYCRDNKIVPSQHHLARRYWVCDSASDFKNPEGVSAGSLWEGATTSILVNKFERNRVARNECLRHYGYACSACGCLLRDFYGSIAEDFIHVHHLVPLSQIGEDYQVDPIKDLRPVCPNCHSIIHRRKKALTIEEVRKLLRR